ncbi:23S rRNA (adenine(2030)-N(6))-methyltransferase RlmJ [Spongiibacter taiwanensis]|uniref:23S rRNA (adenine(2030)-N(6))-methyltransferase RlmJ n=1 Tax=Spongiibacter taiwanensis TaxID=1748242 RepID=UPI002035C5FF|nr:23S rRNA (adenine(2030)-N(6))-methyltransferase RlmJ [Spongiibacter taiwanensis]USA42055.1 23S rRNA (adenine(2030)-N(6))-methyltransferase RlmJ [Spongiibacter taiwanensis]
MLSYRHGYHAGNHADVLKHLTQVLILDHMLEKDTAISYLDSHAGAGLYDLGSTFAIKNREFDGGIGRLASLDPVPAEIQRYLAVVAQCRQGQPNLYPGSPAIALAMLRPQDRAHLFELHPKDADALQRRFYRRAKINQSDGFAGIKGLLPPPSRRALVLMDPPFEIKSDYQKACQSLRDSRKRFAGGVYALWYPLLDRPESIGMAAALADIAPDNWLHCSLSVAPLGSGGMVGSAMYVINPPWKLAEQLKSALPVLADALAVDGQGRWSLDYHGR